MGQLHHPTQVLEVEGCGAETYNYANLPSDQTMDGTNGLEEKSRQLATMIMNVTAVAIDADAHTGDSGGCEIVGHGVRHDCSIGHHGDRQSLVYGLVYDFPPIGPQQGISSVESQNLCTPASETSHQITSFLCREISGILGVGTGARGTIEAVSIAAARQLPGDIGGKGRCGIHGRLLLGRWEEAAPTRGVCF